MPRRVANMGGGEESGLDCNNHFFFTGAGIFVPSGSRVLSNNSLITTLSVLKFIPSFHCLSGSAQPNVGNLIGPLGNDITLSTTGPLTVARGGLSDPGTLSVHSASPLGLHDIGIYTYRTPDENGDVIDFHFGLYYSSNSGIKL